jgi:hypothetical protein
MIFRNIEMDLSHIELLLLKIFNPNEILWPASQIPMVINSALTLASVKINRIFVFEKILLFFNDLYERSVVNETSLQRTEFIDAETLSIMHFIHLVKIDRTAAKDLLKLFKSKVNQNISELIEPFTFCLIISLIQVLPKQDGVIEMLSKVIIRIFDTEIKWKKYYWISKCFTEDEKKLSKKLKPASKCRLLETEPVISGLIKFIFELFDSNGVRMTRASKAVSLKEHVTIYSSEMMRDLFRHSAISREEILQQLTERIFSSGNNQKSAVFIDQLTILILYEPASSFQDFFRKFKSRLDHMIHMSPLIAIEFLNAIKPLLKYDSIYKDNLIVTLKKSVFQNDIDIRKVGLNGLISLLVTTKLPTFLPSSQASQSMSLSQSQSQMSHKSLSQERNAEKNCLEIFLSLRRCLTQQPEIRSKLYQSCFSLITQNKTLIGPTLNLLLINLQDHLIKRDFETVLDLSKCIKLDDNTNDFALVEPIDSLLHAIHLCQYKYINSGLQTKFQDQLDEDIKKHSDMIKLYLNSLKDTFTQHDVQLLIDNYKTQVASKILSKKKNCLVIGRQQQHQSQARMGSQHITSQRGGNTQRNETTGHGYDMTIQFTPFYQCILGSLEVLIEHFFMNGIFKTTRELYKKFNQMYDLICKQFAKNDNNSSVTKQRTTTTAPKKQRTNSKIKKTTPNEDNDDCTIIDAENSNDGTVNGEEIRTTAFDNTSSNLDLTVPRNTNPLLESTTYQASGAVVNKMASTKKTTSRSVRKVTSAIGLNKFDYEHRISYTCLLRFLDKYFGYSAF